MERITRLFSQRGLGTKIESIFVLGILAGAIVTLTIGGSVKPSTIEIVHSPISSNVYGETVSGVEGYSDNLTEWAIGYQSPSVTGRISNPLNSLVLNGSFQTNPSTASVAIFKSIDVNITAYPILFVNLTLSAGMGYGIRFFSQYPNGTLYSVWWESSPLDHRTGIGNEVLRINMEREAILSTGHSVNVVTKEEIYVEYEAVLPKNFTLTLSKLVFETATLKPVVDNQYRAIYFGLKDIPEANASWYLNKVSLASTIRANASTIFSIYIFQGFTISGSTSTTGLTFSPLTSYSQYSFYPNLQPQIFTELLPPSNASIVFVASAGAFQSAILNSVDFEFLPTTQIPSLSQNSLALYYVYFIFFLFLLPVGIGILVFREFISRSAVPKTSIVSVLAFGLLCRLALATTTAHVFDMNVYLTSTRGWFQLRDPTASLGPTLPFTFFLYWLGYSPYALLQLVGFQDAHFLGNAAGVVEGVFVRLFSITMDVAIFFLLFRFRRNGSAFVWATFYFLNPLAIFISSVWGQYESISAAFIVWGLYWMNRQRFTRSALLFIVSGLVELIGFLPYTLLLLRTVRLKLYKTLPFLALAALPIVFYPPETSLISRLVLGLLGFTGSQFSGPGLYNLLGSFPQLSFASQFRPLLVSEIVVLGAALFDLFKGRFSTDRLTLYVTLSFISLLLFSNLLASWVWLLPMTLLYAIMKDKPDLGGYMLVFGTTLAFLTISNTSGSAYLLLGNVGSPILPQIEAINNRVQIFALMSAFLSIVLICLLKYGSGSAPLTMVRTSAMVFSLYVLLYFWLGVYPI